MYFTSTNPDRDRTVSTDDLRCMAADRARERQQAEARRAAMERGEFVPSAVASIRANCTLMALAQRGIYGMDSLITSEDTFWVLPDPSRTASPVEDVLHALRDVHPTASDIEFTTSGPTGSAAIKVEVAA